MTILNDSQIIELVKSHNMIEPFQPNLIREVEDYDINQSFNSYHNPNKRKVISYGLSSYGYDLTLSSNDFKIFSHLPGEIVNPKKFNPNFLFNAELNRSIYGEYFILPKNTYALGVVNEKINIPNDITVLFIGKSTYARCGIIANLTPGEAGWTGYLTVEISNSSSADVMIFVNEGIVQALFFKGDPCITSYEDRSGKYQNQEKQVTFSKV